MVLHLLNEQATIKLLWRDFGLKHDQSATTEVGIAALFRVEFLKRQTPELAKKKGQKAPPKIPLPIASLFVQSSNPTEQILMNEMQL